MLNKIKFDRWITSMDNIYEPPTSNNDCKWRKNHRRCVYNLSNWEETLAHYRLNTLLSTGTILNKLKYEIKFISVPWNVKLTWHTLTRRRRRIKEERRREIEEGVGEGKGWRGREKCENRGRRSRMSRRRLRSGMMNRIFLTEGGWSLFLFSLK